MNHNQNEKPPVDPFSQLMFGSPMDHQPNHQPSTQKQTKLPSSLNSFIGEDGNLDMTKVMNNADKVFKLIDQAGPMIKQVSPFLNMFKKK